MWSRVGDIVREVAEKSKLGVGTGEVSLVVSDLVNDYLFHWSQTRTCLKRTWECLRSARD